MEDDSRCGTTAYIRENLDLHLMTGRYSTILVRELAEMFERRSGNVFAILDEIAALEGTPSARPSLTKPPTMFVRPPLTGLWHKHYNQASFLHQNVWNHWRANDFAAHAARTIGEAAIPEDKVIGALIHAFVIGGYRERSEARRLTGQWIVFARRDDVNTYLTLGTHGDDAAILQRVLGCANEFPELDLDERRVPAR